MSKPPAQATGLTLRDLFREVAARAPEALAVVDGETRLSFAELEARIDAYAKALLNLGVARGDRVAMLVPPSLDFWVALHAATSIGAIWVGVNPRYQQRDFAHLLEDSAPAVLLAVSPFDDRDYCAELRPLLPNACAIVCHGTPSAGALALSDVLAAGAAVSDADLAAARARVDPEDAAVIVYTSGTTGRPKGAMLSHRAIVSSARANAAWMGADDLARSVCAAPVNHVGAINNICTNVLAAGGTLIFHPRVDLPALGALSRQEKPTYLVSSPTGFAMMMSNPRSIGERLRHTRLIVFGGAMTALSVLEQIAPYGSRLSSVYGQTETCGIITHTDPGDALEAHAETIGRPLAGAEARIAGADGAEVPVGETGEIQIRGPHVMSGYFRNPQATAEAFTADGFLRTGDLGRRRPDGNLVFVGRLKEMFKSGGYNVYPVEVEQAICEHPAVALAAVVPMDHPTFQEVGMAFVEPRPGASVTGDELRDFLKARIANYKVPKAFEIQAELPKLPNSKIDKMSLRALAAERATTVA
ncbi:class I adenylate-forming enzyme family protein [Phenylobacterium aquaticum]|uniref:class I adenylate-forming enzyme family protein n=1 Tax=Phenylobacterium aquaticum TaxID=1763816 RepID=UPI001F5C7B59|nr:class I adenylate-forming enzyme family protein [Phenylobacterium aquaticum]MCI3132155.1 acyl--CoA ligase [Phenylobacterium aquaticum]